MAKVRIANLDGKKDRSSYLLQRGYSAKARQCGHYNSERQLIQLAKCEKSDNSA